MEGSEYRVWTRRLLPIALAAVNSACSSTPTGPTTSTPTPATPTCSAGAPQPMTSFTANPSTITYGDTFTLSWSAPCGFVSLRQKDSAQFALNQPSNGSYELKRGLAGYPAGPGAIVYEATNGDAAQRFYVTVTVKQGLPPTVSVSASPDSCHPQNWNSAPCSVTCTANATSPSGDTLGYRWSGCASGTGSTGTCSFTQPGATATCTATVTDSGGGSATDSKTVRSTNTAPDLALASNTPWQCPGGLFADPQPSQSCALLVRVSDDDPDPSHAITVNAVANGVTCPVGSVGWSNSTQLYIATYTGGSGTGCWFDVTITDDWSLSKSATFRYNVP